MVLCIVVGCGSKSGKHSVTFNCIPKVVTSQGEEWEDLTRERRNRWIAAVSRDDVKSKNILDSERVCGLHFVSGKPAPTWDKHNIDWVPTLNLGKKEYRDQEQKKLQQIAAGERAMRARERLKRKIQQEEIEVTEKQKVLNVSGDRVANIEFSESYNNCTKDLLEKQSECNEEATTITTENQNDEIFCSDQNEEMATESQEQPIKRNAEVQTEEFDYMFCKETYTPPDQDYFRSDDKVRFYTGLPSFDVLMATSNSTF